MSTYHFTLSIDPTRTRSDSRRTVCGILHPIGYWLNEDRVIRNPLLFDYACKHCIRWVNKNRPDLIIDIQRANELFKITWNKLKVLEE